MSDGHSPEGKIQSRSGVWHFQAFSFPPLRFPFPSASSVYLLKYLLITRHASHVHIPLLFAGCVGSRRGCESEGAICIIRVVVPSLKRTLQHGGHVARDCWLQYGSHWHVVVIRLSTLSAFEVAASAFAFQKCGQLLAHEKAGAITPRKRKLCAAEKLCSSFKFMWLSHRLRQGFGNHYF